MSSWKETDLYTWYGIWHSYTKIIPQTSAFITCSLMFENLQCDIEELYFQWFGFLAWAAACKGTPWRPLAWFAKGHKRRGLGWASNQQRSDYNSERTRRSMVAHRAAPSGVGARKTRNFPTKMATVSRFRPKLNDSARLGGMERVNDISTEHKTGFPIDVICKIKQKNDMILVNVITCSLCGKAIWESSTLPLETPPLIKMRWFKHSSHRQI
jgi:hypothetical protein